MPNPRVRTYSFVLGLIGAATATWGPGPDLMVDESRNSVQRHQRNGVAGYQVEALSSVEGGSSDKRVVASFVEPVAGWPEAACIRTDEPPPPVRDLWSIGLLEQPKRPIGYSALDHCTPIFIDRGGKHSDGDLPSGTGIVLEGFYENTATGGRIEVNPNALMQKTEQYRAVVLSHEELHAVLERVSPAGLNQAILPAHVVGKARTQLRTAGYEGGDLDDEILPRLLTHDPDGTGLTGVAEEDFVISGAMRRLLTQSQTHPELRRVYWQLQRSHALTHDLMSGKVGIGALMCGDRIATGDRVPIPTSSLRPGTSQ